MPLGIITKPNGTNVNTSIQKEGMIILKQYKNQLIQNGIIKLIPSWVPRTFSRPGGRLKLPNKDLYAFGTERGGICERWLASTTSANNGPLTSVNEGQSYVASQTSSGTEKVLFKDMIEEMGNEILGEEIISKYKGWRVLNKLFDNYGRIPHHIHLREEHAKLVGKTAKPEAYYFPVQLNHKLNSSPISYMGFEPGTTKEDVIKSLERWDQGDNGMVYLSKAYRLQPGTGWSIDAGIIHGPGSLVTFEPQNASDVMSIFESVVEGNPISRDFLVQDVPDEKKDDLDFIVNLIDWEKSLDPEFKKNNYCEPVFVDGVDTTDEYGYVEKWVVYGKEDFSSKELTVLPRSTVTIKDPHPYGILILQGYGTLNGMDIETPTEIPFGSLTSDEFFVTYAAANEGVTIENKSNQEMVLLKYFGPGNPENPLKQ